MNKYYVNYCFQEKLKSNCIYTNVGCVLVLESYGLISTGYNESPDDCLNKAVCLKRESGGKHGNNYKCNAIHAEEMAINKVLGILNRPEDIFSKITLYTTSRPCERCSDLIKKVGIRKVKYIDEYPGYYINWFKENNIELIKL